MSNIEPEIAINLAGNGVIAYEFNGKDFTLNQPMVFETFEAFAKWAEPRLFPKPDPIEPTCVTTIPVDQVSSSNLEPL